MRTGFVLVLNDSHYPPQAISMRGILSSGHTEIQINPPQISIFVGHHDKSVEIKEAFGGSIENINVGGPGWFDTRENTSVVWKGKEARRILREFSWCEAVKQATIRQVMDS